jgi:hypothetical protein
MFGAPAGGASGAMIPGTNGNRQSADDWNF